MCRTLSAYDLNMFDDPSWLTMFAGFLGKPGKAKCPAGTSNPPSTVCKATAQMLIPPNTFVHHQKHLNKKAVPPGCSIQTGQSGDRTIHYNTEEKGAHVPHTRNSHHHPAEIQPSFQVTAALGVVPTTRLFQWSAFHIKVPLWLFYPLFDHQVTFLSCDLNIFECHFLILRCACTRLCSGHAHPPEPTR